MKLDTIEKMDSTYGIQASSHTPQHAKWGFFFKCQKFMFIQVRGYTFVKWDFCVCQLQLQVGWDLNPRNEH